MNFLSRHKYILSLLIIIGCFIFIQPVYASVADTVASVVGNIVSALVWILGKVLIVLMLILIWVCSYNGFITSAAVTNGWVILRDVCNMFFILILLVIAFATVLNIEGYSWKKLLPKMLLMAVLINFSRLICGVIIDFAQVIMLTFVNGFRDIGGGNLSDMLGINELLRMNSQGTTDVSALSIMGTYVLALGYVIVSIGVIVIILFVLIMRMVMLWILVTLSPLAYLLGALPNTSKYASKWWSQFTENVVSGPILAFFIWLSFASATVDVEKIKSSTPQPNRPDELQYQQEITKSTEAGLSTAGTPEGMLKFIISIGMLIGGVIITKDLGGAAARAVGKGMAVNNWAKKKAGNAAKAVATNTGKFAAQTSMRAAGNISTFAGNKLNEKTGGKYGDSLQKSGAFVKSWGTDIRQTRKEEKKKARMKTLEKLGMKSETMDLGTEALDTKLGRSLKGGLTMGAGALLMSNPVTAAYGAALMGIGAGHMGGSLSSKWIGKKVKDYSYTRQQNKNINQANQALTDIDARKKDEKENRMQEKYPEYKEAKEKMEKEIKEKEIFAEDQIKAVDLGLQNDIKNMKDNGAPQSDIDKLEDEASLKKGQIELGVKLETDRLQSQFDAQYGSHKLKVEAEIDAKYRPHIEEITKFKNENELSKKRDTTIKGREKDRSDDLLKAEQKRIIQIENVKKQFSDGPAVLRDRKIKEVNAQSTAEKSDINKKYDDWISEYKERSVSLGKVPNTILESVVPKVMHTTGEKIEKSNPNRLTIDAMELGAKEYKDARKTVDSLRNTNIKEFRNSYWSTPTGINSAQEKMLTVLASNSKESKDAIQNVVKGLKDLQGTLKEEDKGWIESMMRGVAGITEKKPDTKASYNTFIEVLEALHPDKKTVESFKSKK